MLETHSEPAGRGSGVGWREELRADATAVAGFEPGKLRAPSQAADSATLVVPKVCRFAGR